MRKWEEDVKVTHLTKLPFANPVTYPYTKRCTRWMCIHCAVGTLYETYTVFLQVRITKRSNNYFPLLLIDSATIILEYKFVTLLPSTIWNNFFHVASLFRSYARAFLVSVFGRRLYVDYEHKFTSTPIVHRGVILHRGQFTAVLCIATNKFAHYGKSNYHRSKM